MNENETTSTEATTTDQPTFAQDEGAPAEATTPTEPEKPADEATPASDGAAAEAGQGEGSADDKKPSSITPEERAAQEQLGEDLNALYQTHIKRGGSVAGFGAAGAAWAAMTAIGGGLTMRQHQQAASHAYLVAIRNNKRLGTAEAMRLLLG